MESDSYVVCQRCGRNAPAELDGDPDGDPGPWVYAEWRLNEDESVICPGCLPDADLREEIEYHAAFLAEHIAAESISPDEVAWNTEGWAKGDDDAAGHG